MEENFAEFYSGNEMFLYIGTNLNRTTDQIWRRLRALYHLRKRDKIPSSEDSYILTQAKALRKFGVHRRFKAMGDEMGRYTIQVNRRYDTLMNKSSAEAINTNALFQLVDGHRGSLDEIPFSLFAEKLGCSKERLEKYWVKEGRKMYVRSKLPGWTLEDSKLLLAKVEASGEDDEKCVDFKTIFDQNFKGKCEDCRRLRDHFTRLRRDVPLYMLSDLQSVVFAVRKEIERKQAEYGKNGRG